MAADQASGAPHGDVVRADAVRAADDGSVALGERFMAAFTDIEHKLRASGGSKPALSQLARDYLSAHGLDAYQPAFADFVELRNMLAHARRYDGHLFATPAPGVVAEIEKLRGLMLAPPRVLDVLSRDAVITCAPDDQLSTVLALIADYGIATVPCYDAHGYAGLLTLPAIARWLAASWRHGDDASSVPVRDVLSHAKPAEAARFVDEKAGVPEVVALLTAPPVAPAVLVTPQATRTAAPVAIATAADLPALVDVLAP